MVRQSVAALLGLFCFIYVEATHSSSQLPIFKAKLRATAQLLVQWLNTRFGLTTQKLPSYVSQASSRAAGLLIPNAGPPQSG